MAIPDNYIDKITKDGESRMISPAADKVRVDNEHYEGDNLDDILDEIAEAIDEAGSGDGTVKGVKVGSTTYEPDGETGVVDLSTPIAGKVDKVPGKGLSTNDYTDAEKTKLQNLPTADGLTQQLSSKANAADVVKGIRAYGSNTNLPKSQDGIVTLPESSAPDLSGYATTSAMNQAIENKLTEVSIAAISETDAKFFIRDGALCISTENFVTVTTPPSMSSVINSDGTATITITHTENGATIEYSLDNGTTWQTYSTALTINTAGTHTIKARAQVSGKPKSDVVTETVTLVESSMPTLETTKTSSDVTLTASGNGTVAMTVDGTAQTSPYTVNRTSSNQTLSVVVTNKEANKLIATLTQSVVVPKLTVVSVKIRNFVKRVVDAGGHLIFGESSNFAWSNVTSAEWAEGYDDSVSPATFDQSLVTNADLLAVLEATQEKYDEHTELLGCEPSLDFLGYTGTRNAPTKLMSVDQTLDAGSLSSVIITNDGLISATASITGINSANIKWSQFTNAYSARMAASVNGTLTDFNSIYLYATPVTPNVEDGFINPSKSESNYYYKNGIFEGFINESGSPGCTGRTDGYLSFVARQSNFYAQYYAPYIESIHVDKSSTMRTTINGSIATALTSEERVAMDVGSVFKVAYAYMQMKANCPMLVLAGVKSS